MANPSFLVAGHAPEDVRIDVMADEMAEKALKASANEFKLAARKLVEVDEKENNPEDDGSKLGQNTREAYPLADVL
jgi:hypothetical protein